jgi:type III secretion system SsaH family protein
MILPQATRQLIVSSALAATNHGLTIQAETIVSAFPELIPDPENRAICQALVLFGLSQPATALNCLGILMSPEAVQLRQLIVEAHPELVSHPTPDPMPYILLTRSFKG